MDDWTPIESTFINSGINSIHCDTRDFHIKCNTTSIENRNERKSLFRNICDTPEYLIEEADILDWLKSLREMSGGIGEWRMLSFDVKHCKDWLKYIGFYRVPETTKFVVCNRNTTPIDYRKCTKETLNIDTLNFCED